MSRLIDAEAYEQSLIENGWDEADDEFFTGGVFELLREAPTVPAILLDKVKNAREEIANLQDPEMYWSWEEKDYGKDEMKMDVLEILDKLIAESEE